MTNVHRTFLMTTLLFLTSGVGCATFSRIAKLPLVDGGPGETLKRLTTPMRTPSVSRPAEYDKYLSTLMETPAVKRQVVTSRAAPAPFAAEERSKEGSVPSPEPPPAVPSTPPATAMAPLPPPAKSEEVAQTPPAAVLPLSAKEVAGSGTHSATRIPDGTAHNLGVRPAPVGFSRIEGRASYLKALDPCSLCGGGTLQGRIHPLP